MKVNIGNHGFTIIWGGVYYFCLSNYPNISPWELKKLLMFIEYEKQHGRQAEIICEDADILSAVDYAIAYPDSVNNAVLPNKITECTYCKQRGCLTKFVCHTATLDNAKKILTSGKLLSAVKAFGKTAEELVSDVRNAASDPADYFDYIMFAWGNCTAGDNLVMERALGRGATDDERENALTPGVRFYFKYDAIIKHPDYVFDGYHPAKVKDELVLSNYMYACIVPGQYQNILEKCILSDISHRVSYLPQNKLGLLDWTKKVYDFVDGCDDNNEPQNIGGQIK